MPKIFTLKRNSDPLKWYVKILVAITDNTNTSIIHMKIVRGDTAL